MLINKLIKMNFAVYSKDGCPYCDKVKTVLQLTGSKFVVYNLGEHFEKKRILSGVWRWFYISTSYL